MALFAIWHEDRGGTAQRYAALRAAAHIVAEHEVTRSIPTARGSWQIAAFACASHYYRPQDQVWVSPAGDEACIIHGLVWRTGTGALLDAPAVAVLLDEPGARLPDDVAGEYAIARLHRSGTLEAFGDPAGLHQLFHAGRTPPILSNRAGFAALLAGPPRPDPASGLWLTAIGYRVGDSSGWAGIRRPVRR